jgi:hypothetical protein
MEAMMLMNLASQYPILMPFLKMYRETSGSLCYFLLATQFTQSNVENYFMGYAHIAVATRVCAKRLNCRPLPQEVINFMGTLARYKLLAKWALEHVRNIEHLSLFAEGESDPNWDKVCMARRALLPLYTWGGGRYLRVESEEVLGEYGMLSAFEKQVHRYYLVGLQCADDRFIPFDKGNERSNKEFRFASKSRRYSATMVERLQLLAPQLGEIHRQRVEAAGREKVLARAARRHGREEQGDMGLSRRYLPIKEQELFQQFCTLIVAGQIWDPDTDTVRIFSGKFDPEEFDRNPEKQGQVVPALTPVSFEGKRVALEAVYGAESRENRLRANISVLGLNHDLPDQFCPVPVPGVPPAAVVSSAPVEAESPEAQAIRLWKKRPLKDLQAAALSVGLKCWGSRAKIVDRMLLAGHKAPVCTAGDQKATRGPIKFYANSTRRPGIVASDKLQKDLIKWQRQHEIDRDTLLTGYHIFTDEQYEELLLKVQALQNVKFRLARNLLPDEPIRTGVLSRAYMVDLVILVRAEIAKVTKKEPPPRPDFPLANMSGFTTRRMPLATVLNPALQTTGDPRFINSDASRGLARGTVQGPGWGQSCPPEKKVPVNFSPYRMLAARSAGVPASTTPVSAVPRAVDEDEQQCESDDETASAERGSAESDICPEKTLAEVLLDEQVDGAGAEEEEDIEDGIPDDE